MRWKTATRCRTCTPTSTSPTRCWPRSTLSPPPEGHGVDHRGISEPAELHARSKLRQPADEEPTLQVSGGQPQGVLECLPGFVVAAETAQQLGAGGMEVAVLAEI